jgi:hypothetical protein
MTGTRNFDYLSSHTEAGANRTITTALLAPPLDDHAVDSMGASCAKGIDQPKKSRRPQLGGDKGATVSRTRSLPTWQLGDVIDPT